MFHISKNVWLDSLFKLMLLSAIIHVFLLFIYVFNSYDFNPLIPFNLLGFDLLFPTLKGSIFSTMFSIVFLILIYLIFLINSMYNKK